MRKALTTAHLYPDGGGFYLRQALAKKLGVEIDNIVLGAGSNEIIEFLYHAFVAPGDEVVAGDRAFVIYSIMAKTFQARCIEVPFKGHTHDLKAMREAITEKTKLVFVANPNNPTGTRVTNAELDSFIRSLPPHVIACWTRRTSSFSMIRRRPSSMHLEAISEMVGQASVPVQISCTGEGSHSVDRDAAPTSLCSALFPRSSGWPGCASATASRRKSASRFCRRSGSRSTSIPSRKRARWRRSDDTAHIRKTKAMTRRGLAYLEKRVQAAETGVRAELRQLHSRQRRRWRRNLPRVAEARRDCASDARLQDAGVGACDRRLAGGESEIHPGTRARSRAGVSPAGGLTAKNGRDARATRRVMKGSWKSLSIGGVVIVLLTIVVYLPALQGGFVWDDHHNITGNQLLRTLEGLEQTWMDPHASIQYYPLTYTGFWVEYQAVGVALVRLSCRQRAPARLERLSGGGSTHSSGCTGGMACGRAVCCASRACGIGGLDHGVEERTFGILLSQRVPCVSSFSAECQISVVVLFAFVSVVSVRLAKQDVHSHAARRHFAGAVVEARTNADIGMFCR